MGSGTFLLAGQLGLDEVVDLSVHYTLDFGRFTARAVIFDHGVGVENITANLTPPFDFLLALL